MKNFDDMSFEETLEALAKEGRLMKEVDRLINDERILSFPSDEYFTSEHWTALMGETPMTQEMFDECLAICDGINDSVNFQRIVEQFPEFEVKYSPEICAKHKAVHDEVKAEYLAKYGDDAIFFRE